MRWFFLALTVLLTATSYSANAARMPSRIGGDIIDLITKTIVTQDGQEAIGFCTQAEQLAAQYDRNPYYDGQIAVCFGDAERKRNNKQAACDYYAQAIARYQTARPEDRGMAFAPASQYIEGAQQWRTQLGC